MYAPLIRILTASICSVAVTPGSRERAVSSECGSVNGATISRSAWSVRRSGATAGECDPASAGTRETAIRRALVSMVMPGRTGALPVVGRTTGRLRTDGAAPADRSPPGGALSTADENSDEGPEHREHGNGGRR